MNGKRDEEKKLGRPASLESHWLVPCVKRLAREYKYNSAPISFFLKLY